MERSDDTTVPEIKGDFFYVGALSNEGALLTLRDPTGAIIDEVGARRNPWVAGDNASKKTMQWQEEWFTATPTPRLPNQKDPEPAPIIEESALEAELPLVVINEIAWMGTPVSAAHEWLELRNTSSTEVSLAFWQLIFAADASSTPDAIITFDEADSIVGEGFFLLERSSSSTIPTREGKVYTGGQMSNAGEFIALLDSLGNIVDSIDASTGWPAGENITSPQIKRASMERTKDTTTWYTFKGNEEEYGTPMRQNSEKF
jgi:hypothetical protein